MSGRTRTAPAWSRRPSASSRSPRSVAVAPTFTVPSPPDAKRNGGARPATLRVGVVSTYPPRACGIGTFSRDLRDALLGAEGVAAVDIAAIVRDEDVDEGGEVVTRIHQDQ